MKDLTKGNPYKLIFLFALPCLLGCVFQQLYNMVDTIIVGNTVNADAFTGVGLTGPITFFVMGFGNGLTSGFSVGVSQKFGAGDEKGMRQTIATSYVLCAVMSVVLTAIAVPLAGPLLRLMNTPDAYFDYAVAYLTTIFAGITATVFYNILAGVLRAIGDSRSPLYFLIVAAVLNVGLDFAFIVGLKLHYIGAALATVTSQVVSGALCLVYMLKKYPLLRLKKEDFVHCEKRFLPQLAIGLPMALQFSITAIGSMIQQTALNGLDSTYPGAVTAYAAASKIDNLSSQSFVAIGTAMANYTGQNYGAGDWDRIKKGVRVGMIYTLAGMAIGFLLCVALYSPLMDLFLNTDLGGEVALHYDDTIAYGRQYLLFQSCCYLFLGTIFVYRNALQGMGKSAVTMLAGVTELAGRALTAFVFVRIWGFDGFCVSNPIAWLFADVFLLITYFVCMRHKGTEKSRTPKHSKKPCPQTGCDK